MEPVSTIALVSVFKEAIGNAIEKVADGVGNYISSIGEGYKNLLTSAGDSMVSISNGIGTRLANNPAIPTVA